jgi:hypothetical protein
MLHYPQPVWALVRASFYSPSSPTKSGRERSAIGPFGWRYLCRKRDDLETSEILDYAPLGDRVPARQRQGTNSPTSHANAGIADAVYSGDDFSLKDVSDARGRNE